jgi:hypothetical protein
MLHVERTVREPVLTTAREPPSYPPRPASAHARAHHGVRACKCAHHGGTALLYPTGA